jgi:hypothetical protein
VVEVVVDGGLVVVVVLGLLVERVLVRDGALVVVTRGVGEEVGDLVDVRSDERAALLAVAREVGVPALVDVRVSADSEAEADFALAGAGAWACGNIRARTGTAVSPPIQSSTRLGNGCQLPGRPASRR